MGVRVAEAVPVSGTFCAGAMAREGFQKVEPTLFPAQISEAANQGQSDQNQEKLASAALRLFFIIVEQIIQISRCG